MTIIYFFDIGLIIFLILILIIGLLFGVQTFFTFIIGWFSKYFLLLTIILFLLVFICSFLTLKKIRGEIKFSIIDSFLNLLIFFPIYLNFFFVIFPSFYDGDGLWSLINGLVTLIFSWIFCVISLIPTIILKFPFSLFFYAIQDHKISAILWGMLSILCLMLSIWAVWFVFWWAVPLNSLSAFYTLYGPKVGKFVETVFFGNLRRG